MRFIVLAAAILISVSLWASVAGAQTTQPTAGATADGALEVRATQAFNKGDYNQALPMLQKLASDLKTAPAQADKLGMVQEQIRVCEKNATPVQVASAASVTSPVIASNTPQQLLPVSTAGANTAAITAPARTPHPAPKAGEVLEMAIKDLGNFEYDADNNGQIPADVKALSGSTIRLHGYMIPMDQAESISKFALVPSLFNCCFGQPPQIQHTIIVTCPKGKAVNYYPDEIIVEGKLTVDVIKDDGFIVGIFSLETSSVKPAPK